MSIFRRNHPPDLLVHAACPTLTLNHVSSAMAERSRLAWCLIIPRDTESTPFRGESVGHLTLKDIQVSPLKKMQFENGTADAEDGRMPNQEDLKSCKQFPVSTSEIRG